MAKKRFEPSFENLPIDQIIGAPLRATASANSMMAREQVQFLMDYCFQKKGDNYSPVMIEMELTRAVMDTNPSGGGEPQLRQFTTRFSLPILTILPINSLSVQDFEIDFDMEITTLTTEEKKTGFTRTDGSDTTKEFKLMGKVSNKDPQQNRNSQYSKKIDSKLSINIKGGQLPLPTGLTSIMDLYTKNIDPIEVPREVNKEQENKEA